MAYSAIIQASCRRSDGTLATVYVEKDAGGGSPVTCRLGDPAYRVISGSQSDDTDVVARQGRCVVYLSQEAGRGTLAAAVLDMLASSATPKEYRIRIVEGTSGGQVEHGPYYVAALASNVRAALERGQTIAITGTDGLRSLERQPFVDGEGEPYRDADGDFESPPASAVIARALALTGASGAFDALTTWQPSTGPTHQLDVLVPLAAYYRYALRDQADGATVQAVEPEKALAVLEEIGHLFRLQVLRHAGAWHALQVQALAAGADPARYAYDGAGTRTGSASGSTAPVAIDDKAFTPGAAHAGRAAHRLSRLTYEQTSAARAYLENGDFEAWDPLTGLPAGWSLVDGGDAAKVSIGSRVTTGSRSLRIGETEANLDLPQACTTFVERQVSVAPPASGAATRITFDVTLRAQFAESGPGSERPPGWLASGEAYYYVRTTDGSRYWTPRLGWQSAGLFDSDTAITAGEFVTSIPIEGLDLIEGPLVAGDVVEVHVSPTEKQQWTLSADVAAGAAALPVQGATATQAFPAGTDVLRIGSDGNPTAVPLGTLGADQPFATGGWKIPFRSRDILGQITEEPYTDQHGAPRGLTESLVHVEEVLVEAPPVGRGVVLGLGELVTENRSLGESVGYPDYVAWVHYDNVRVGVEVEDEGIFDRTYGAVDEAVEGGLEASASTRVGDGPHAGAPGALLRPDGSLTAGWTVGGVGTGVPLHQLSAVEHLRGRRRGRDVLQVTYADRDEDLTPVRARTLDGRTYWPVHWQREEPSGRVTETLVQVIDEGVPPAEDARLTRPLALYGGRGDTALYTGLSNNIRTAFGQMAVTTTSGVIPGGVEVTSVPIVPVDAVFKAGEKVAIVDRRTGSDVLLEVTADYPRNGTDIEVAPFTLPFAFDQGSWVIENAASANLRVSITDNAFRIIAESFEICRLTQDYDGQAPVSQVAVTPALADVRAGTELEIISSATDAAVTVTLSGTLGEGDQGLDVEPVTVLARAGDAVIVPGRSSTGLFLVTPEEVLQRVTQHWEGVAIATLDSAVSGPTTLLPGTRAAGVLDGARLVVIGEAGTHVVFVDGDQPGRGFGIAIDEYDFGTPGVEAGAIVRASDVTLLGQIGVVAGEVELRATRQELADGVAAGHFATLAESILAGEYRSVLYVDATTEPLYDGDEVELRNVDPESPDFGRAQRWEVQSDEPEGSGLIDVVGASAAYDFPPGSTLHRTKRVMEQATAAMELVVYDSEIGNQALANAVASVEGTAPVIEGAAIGFLTTAINDGAGISDIYTDGITTELRPGDVVRVVNADPTHADYKKYQDFSVNLDEVVGETDIDVSTETALYDFPAGSPVYVVRYEAFQSIASLELQASEQAATATLGATYNQGGAMTFGIFTLDAQPGSGTAVLEVSNSFIIETASAETRIDQYGLTLGFPTRFDEDEAMKLSWVDLSERVDFFAILWEPQWYHVYLEGDNGSTFTSLFVDEVAFDVTRSLNASNLLRYVSQQPDRLTIKAPDGTNFELATVGYVQDSIAP